MANKVENLPIGAESQKNCDGGPRPDILKTLNVSVIGTRVCETAGKNDSGEGVRRYTEFHDDPIDNKGSDQQRLDKLFDKARKALRAGDLKTYHSCMELIKYSEDVPLVDALRK